MSYKLGHRILEIRTPREILKYEDFRKDRQNSHRGTEGDQGQNERRHEGYAFRTNKELSKKEGNIASKAVLAQGALKLSLGLRLPPSFVSF